MCGKCHRWPEADTHHCYRGNHFSLGGVRVAEKGFNIKFGPGSSCLICTAWEMPIVFVLAQVGGPMSGRRLDSTEPLNTALRLQPWRGRGLLCWPIGAERSRKGGGPRREGCPDRRTQCAVYMSEQMAFIYILQRWSSLEAFVSSFFVIVRRQSFGNGSD